MFDKLNTTQFLSITLSLIHLNHFFTSNIIYIRFKYIFQEIFPSLCFLNYFQVNLKTANNIKLIIPFNFISNKNDFFAYDKRLF